MVAAARLLLLRLEDADFEVAGFFAADFADEDVADGLFLDEDDLAAGAFFFGTALVAAVQAGHNSIKPPMTGKIVRSIKGGQTTRACPQF